MCSAGACGSGLPGLGPAVSRRRGQGVPIFGSCPALRPTGRQGRATNTGSCPDLIRASMRRCHPFRRCVWLWTAGTGPGSEPEGGGRACPYSAHARCPALRQTGMHGRATNTGSCPDLIRASMRRSHVLRRCMSLWTTGTRPGGEPKGDAWPRHKHRLMPGLRPGHPVGGATRSAGAYGSGPLGLGPVLSRRGCTAVPHTPNSCPDLIRASMRWCHALCRCVCLWTTGTGPGSEPEGGGRACPYSAHARQ